MGLQNVIDGDGFGLAITGMVIVFSGLVFISLYITALPRFFDWMEARKLDRKADRAARQIVEAKPDNEVARRAAIAVVIQMELANDAVLDDQRITIQHTDEQEAWAFAGKMRSLSKRM